MNNTLDVNDEKKSNKNFKFKFYFKLIALTFIKR